MLGPGVAAYVVLRLTGGSVRGWARSLLRWRVPLRWWAYALGVPVLLFGAVSWLLQLLGRPVDWSLALDRAPAYAGTWLFVLVFGGAMEELGWRGYGLPHLLQRHSPVGATLILGLVWGFWHLPVYGPLGFLVPTLLAFLYTYLWARTRSTLLCVLLHASFTPAQDHLILLPRDEAYSTALDAPDFAVLAVYLSAIAVLLVLTRGRLGIESPRVPAQRQDTPVQVSIVVPLLLVGALMLPDPGTDPVERSDSVDPVERSDSVDRADGAARVLAEHLDAAGIPGGAVVVVEPTGVVEARGVGKTADGEPVTGDTPFMIGSAAKSFTALAVMQLVEDGEVDLDDPVLEYVPELELAEGEPVAEITVRHLLQQTSGLDDLATGPVLSSAEDGTALDAVAELAGSRLVSAPGEEWRYVNANYVLAGLVVERASGSPYPDRLRERVLDPLGLDATHVGTGRGVTPGHRYWFGGLERHGPVQRDGMAAAGYLSSTAEDLGDYLAFYLREGSSLDGTQVLSEDGVRTLTAPGPEARLGPWADGAAADYAMGWMVGGPWRDGLAVFHPGNSPDSSAMLVLLPEQGVGVAVLVPAGHELPLPGNPSLADRIARATAHVAVGEEGPAPVSRWRFYLWFDLVVLALVGVLLWRLATALAAYRRRDSTQRSPRTRWLRPLPALILTAGLLLLPVVAFPGWATAWLWAPDLALVIVVLGALAGAVGAVRLLTAAAGRPGADME